MLPELDAPTVGDLLSITGNAVIVGIVVELIKRTTAMTEAARDRFVPAIAVGCGIALAVIGAVVTAGDLASAVLTGFLAGALSSGLYSLAKSPSRPDA